MSSIKMVKKGSWYLPLISQPVLRNLTPTLSLRHLSLPTALCREVFLIQSVALSIHYLPSGHLSAVVLYFVCSTQSILVANGSS